MPEYDVIAQARLQREERIARARAANRARQASSGREPGTTRHALADRLRRFADRLES